MKQNSAQKIFNENLRLPLNNLPPRWLLFNVPITKKLKEEKMQKWNIFVRVLQLMVFLVPIALAFSIGIFVLLRMLFVQ